jgi:hypothetical protein
MVSFRRAIASFLWVLALSQTLSAQPRAAQQGPEGLVLQGYTLKHKRASDAVALVYPLLSARGTVELQPRGNTLVIRDTLSALSRIVPVLRSFDHPARSVLLEVLIVRASKAQVSPPIKRSDLPEPLTRRLRDLLQYDVYETQAQAALSVLEGQSVIYGVGEEYEVSFRLGTLANDRVKLSQFKVFRLGPEGRSELIHTNLNLWLDQTVSLGLAKSEASRDAFMAVLTFKESEPRRPARKEP